jgi:pimeloyl-ACP methyl ester carboxylesterase
MIEKETLVESHGIQLAGTACLPATLGRFPTVLMIHGSGPLDRDENMPGQKLEVFNTLAHHLARQGIASLRYDKRGCGKSGGDFRTAGHFDHAADAGRCFEYMEQCDYALPDQIYALGHSEGTIVAAQLSPQHPRLAGILLLSPFVDGMESILMKQAAHLAEAARQLKGFGGWLTRMALRDPVGSQRKLIDQIQSSKLAEIRSGGETVNALWLRELMSLDPPAIFRRVSCPILLIGGGKDVQCDAGDVTRIKDMVSVGVEAHVLPHLTHILRNDARPPSILRYAELLARPVEPEVLDLVSDWLAGRIAQFDA